jgi:hypothetical protein
VTSWRGECYLYIALTKREAGKVYGNSRPHFLHELQLICGFDVKRRPQRGRHHVLCGSAPFPDSDVEHLYIVVDIVDVNDFLTRSPYAEEAIVTPAKRASPAMPSRR